MLQKRKTSLEPSGYSKRSRDLPAEGTLRVIPCSYCLSNMQAYGPQWACRDRGASSSGDCAWCASKNFKCPKMISSAVPAAMAAQAAAVAAISKAGGWDDTSIEVPPPKGWDALIFEAKSEHVKARHAQTAASNNASTVNPAASAKDITEIKGTLSQVLDETAAIRRQRDALVEGLQLFCKRLLRDE
ncbi:Fc.00g001840.m01.CDS01 [Cosmosporella sp. VM-42]